MDALKNVFNEINKNNGYDKIFNEFFRGKVKYDSTEHIEQNFCNADQKLIIKLEGGFWYHKEQVLRSMK